MHSILQVLHITLVKIAESVFSSTFLIIVLIIYMMYKKSMAFEKHTLQGQKDLLVTNMIQSILSGILMGILGSFILLLFGISIQISPYYIFLLPIAAVLALFHVRYLCFSYAAGLLGLISLFFQGQVIWSVQMPKMDLDISGLIALVGILHLMESGLIFFHGAVGSIPIIIQKKEKIGAGYLMQKFWPIPFALLVLQQGGEMPAGASVAMPDWWPLVNMTVLDVNKVVWYFMYPLAAALGYGNIAISTSPEKKAKRSALDLMLYSVILLAIAVWSVQSSWLQFIGILIMPLMHECIILKDEQRERKADLFYGLPEKGVRVLEIKADGPAEAMGIQRGDVIQKINGTEIQNMHHLQVLLNNFYTFMWFDIIGADGKDKYVEYAAYPSGTNELGFIPVPERPEKIYRLEALESSSSIYRFFRKNNK